MANKIKIKKVRKPKKIICSWCNGTGASPRDHKKPCGWCGGLKHF